MSAIFAPATGGGSATSGTGTPSTGDRRPRPAAELFARLLRRGLSAEEDSAAAGLHAAAQMGAASAASIANWFRAECSAPATPADSARLTAGVEQARARPRLLIDGGAEKPEARIQIGAGPCAGAEIRLRAVATGVVEAELLTPTASSRQTLAVAMDEVGLRLRAKGVRLRAATRHGGHGDGHERNKHSGQGWPRDDFSGDGA